jgi:hypothetical protein
MAHSGYSQWISDLEAAITYINVSDRALRSIMARAKAGPNPEPKGDAVERTETLIAVEVPFAPSDG